MIFSILYLCLVFAAVTAAEKHILPYFERIVNVFKSYLQPSEDEQRLKVLMQALGKSVSLIKYFCKSLVSLFLVRYLC